MTFVILDKTKKTVESLRTGFQQSNRISSGPKEIVDLRGGNCQRSCQGIFVIVIQAHVLLK